MSCSYDAAVQLIDGAVLPAQFQHEELDRDLVWELIGKTVCRRIDDLDNPWAQRVTIDFSDGKPKLAQEVRAPKGVDPAMSNEDIHQKRKLIPEGIFDGGKQKKIEDLVLNIKDVEDIAELGHLMAGVTANHIA